MSKIKILIDRIFQKFDKDQNDKLDITEAWDFMDECMNFKQDENQTDAKMNFFKEIDANGDNEITREELSKYFEKVYC